LTKIKAVKGALGELMAFESSALREYIATARSALLDFSSPDKLCGRTNEGIADGLYFS
jgi:hypothetical protein